MDRVPEYDITVNCGADYIMDLQFIADDDTEVSKYDAVVFDETLYLAEDSTVTSDVWNAGSIWDILPLLETIFCFTEWQIDACLREYPEAPDGFSFGVSVSNMGFSLNLPREVTSQITYSYGYYDVFITGEDGFRQKLLQGHANIISEVAR